MGSSMNLSLLIMDAFAKLEANTREINDNYAEMFMPGTTVRGQDLRAPQTIALMAALKRRRANIEGTVNRSTLEPKRMNGLIRAWVAETLAWHQTLASHLEP
jgi:hypothetical protein